MSDSVNGEPTGAAREGAALRGAAKAGASRWLSVHDDLLRGLTHTLSNRIGTIAAAAYMVEVQPGSVATITATLRSESDKLQTLLQQLRLLPRRTDAVAEPVIPTDAVAQAIALQEHHPELRDIPVEVLLDGDLQPAYAEPTALVMAVVLILGTAQRACGSGGRVTITIACSTDDVHVVARGLRRDGSLGVGDDLAALDVEAVRWLLMPFGGDGRADDDGTTVTIPTLQAARRAQRS